MFRVIIASLFAIFFTETARATPTTTFVAPSANCQPWAVPHVTYDTYFDQGPTSGKENAPNYPIDTGVTVGFLPLQKIQGEIGYDLLFPQNGPLLLNGKLCTPEATFFEGSPALAFGASYLGLHSGVNDFDVLYFVLQKKLFGTTGYIALGAYHGMSHTLFVNSDGNLVSNGILAELYSPDWNVGLSWLKKIVFAADIQTGKNTIGAGAFGPYFYFTDYVDVLTGPIFFLDRKLQPGERTRIWTVQLDVHIPLR